MVDMTGPQVQSLVSFLEHDAHPMIVLDRVMVNHSYSTLTVMCGAVVLLIVFEMIAGYSRRMYMEVMATRIDGRLSLYLLDRMLSLPLDFFERNPTGLIQAKLSKIYQIRTFLTGKLLSTGLDLVVVESAPVAELHLTLTLKPGETLSVESGLAPMTADQARSLSVRISAAQPAP